MTTLQTHDPARTPEGFDALLCQWGATISRRITLLGSSGLAEDEFTGLYDANEARRLECQAALAGSSTVDVAAMVTKVAVLEWQLNALIEGFTGSDEERSAITLAASLRRDLQALARRTLTDMHNVSHTAP